MQTIQAQLMRTWRYLKNLPRRIKNSGHVPNALTWIRIGLFMVPVILIIKNPQSWWSLAWFVVIVSTDKLDGYLARRWNQTSELGKIIDPAADKLLVVGVVVALCLTNILASPWGWWFLGFNLVRELGITFLRWLRKRGQEGLVIPADEDGKRKMFLQSVGIGAALMPLTYWWWPIVIWLPLTVSLFYSVRSGIHYLRAK